MPRDTDACRRHKEVYKLSVANQLECGLEDVINFLILPQVLLQSNWSAGVTLTRLHKRGLIYAAVQLECGAFLIMR